jgi:hypothetical protein
MLKIPKPAKNPLVDDYEFVYRNDPCWDKSKPEAFEAAWLKFAPDIVQIGDWKDIPHKGDPSIIKLAHLRGRALQKVKDIIARDGLNSGLYLAAQYALRSITSGTENIEAELERDAWGYERVSEQWTAELIARSREDGIDWNEFLQIVGGHAYRKAIPDPS